MIVVPCMSFVLCSVVVEPHGDLTSALHARASSSVAERYTHGAFLMCLIYVTFTVLLFNYGQHDYVHNTY